jgi:hypothetical protein
MLHSCPCILNCTALKFTVRLESPGPNSQLTCSAECLQDNSLAHNTPTETTSRDSYLASPLVHWLNPQKTHVMWQLPTVVVTSLHLHGSVFAELLPRNGLHKPIVLLSCVGSCVCCGRCLAMDLHVTILKSMLTPMVCVVCHSVLRAMQ